MIKETRWKVAVASVLGIGMTFLDQTALNVALPSIQEQFQLSSGALHWVVNAYLLTLTMFLVLGGKLGDHFGKKYIFMFGVGVFALASITSGFALSGSMLILSRALQGFGAAFMVPNCMAIIIDLFPDHVRGKMMGTLISYSLVFLILGPLIGGFFTQYLSWRYIFWINVPVAMVCIYCIAYFIQPVNTHHEKKLDWPGFILLMLWLFGLVFGLMQGAEYQWSNNDVRLSLVIGFVAFIMFVWREWTCEAPFIQLRLFQNRLFSVATFLYAATQMIFMLNVFLPIYFQQVLDFSPAMAGLVFVPTMLPTLFLSRFAGKCRDAYGPRLPVKIGFISLMLGNVWLVSTLWTCNITIIFIGLMFFSMAAPFIYASTSATALSVVPGKMRGVASGITACCRQLGATLGMALLGLVVVHVGHDNGVLHVDKHAYVLAVTAASVLTSVLSVMCFYLTSWLPVKNLQVPMSSEECVTKSRDEATV